MSHASWLRDRVNGAAPGAFRAGALLHADDQEQELTVGDRLHLLPIQSL